MKNLLVNMMLAMATIIGMASCSSDGSLELSPTGDGNVTFTAVLPNGINTRSYADGKTAKSLTYAVYEDGKDGEPVIKVTDANAFASGLTTTININLIKNKTYNIVFWVETENNGYYTFDAASKTVSVSYIDAAQNVEERDAFYASSTFTVPADRPYNQSVELKRPFAQVNFGTDDLDEIVIQNVKANLKTSLQCKAYTKLNLLDGTVSGEQDVTFDATALPENEIFPVEEYKYLSMDYLLVGADKSLVDLTLKVTDGTTTWPDVVVHSAPVHRNYQTNIYGSLLTGGANFNIKIAPGFTKPSYDMHIPVVEVATAAALKTALKSKTESVITLTENISLTGYMEFDNPECPKTLNLNGKTIDGSNLSGTFNWPIRVWAGTLTIEGDGKIIGPGSNDAASDNLIRKGAAIFVHQASSAKPAKVIIKGGDYSIKDGINGNCIVADNGATLEIEGGTFYGGNGIQNAAVAATTSAKVKISGGEFNVGGTDGQGNATIFADKSSQIDIYGGEFKNGATFDDKYWVLNLQDNSNARITCYGGKYIGFNPADSGTEPEGGANFVAEGYKSKKIKSKPLTYEVVKDE